MAGDSADRIPVIVGPTASGKTAVAASLAALTDIEVVSADSRQVYRGLDIGTAKPAAERSVAPYHGLDLIDPHERYSAGRFARDAAGWISGIRSRGRLPVVVGGTGFYLRALFDGLFEEPELDAERRERLRQALARLAGPEQLRWARRLDAGFAGGGSQRALRSLEVALLAGTPLARLQRAPTPPSTCARAWYARLVVPRDLLRERITTRVLEMLERGLVDEVRGLIAAGVPGNAPGLTGVGYAETVAHLDGRLARHVLADAIAASTWRYARRQETWFRRQLNGPVMALDASREPAALARDLLAGYRAALQADRRQP